MGVVVAYFITTYLSDQNSSTQITVAEKTELEGEDSDGDGLSDWEEGLWGTDINQADTDGDGTKDGDEVAQNRDPLDGGPNDKLATSSLRSADEKNTTADIQSKVMPQAFVLAVARDSGEEITNEDIKRLASSLEADSALESTIYTESDLNIKNNASPEDLRAYVNQLSEIIASHISGDQRNPLSVITVEMQDDNTKTIDLSSYISRNQKAIEQLQEIMVPRKYATDHLNIVNSTAKTKTALEAMQYVETDPVKGIYGIQMYKEATRSGEEVGEQLAQKINSDFQ